MVQELDTRAHAVAFLTEEELEFQLQTEPTTTTTTTTGKIGSRKPQEKKMNSSASKFIQNNKDENMDMEGLLMAQAKVVEMYGMTEKQIR